MRITIDIDNELLRAVKAHATGGNRTLEATVEQAPRMFLAGREAAVPDVLPIPVFGGQGMQPGVNLADNAALEDRMNAVS